MKYLNNILLLTLFSCLFLSVPVLSDPLREHLSTFMPVGCCYTNSCCFAVSPEEVIDLGDNMFKIVESGQVIEKTGDSPDGKYWRCACEFVNGEWTVFPKANTRCLYVPFFGS